MNRKSPIFHLLILPVAFLVLQIMLKTDYKWFFLSGHDPAYAFLFNGLNIANGSLQLGLSGFPGIILQCLVGMNLWVYKILTGTPDLTLAVISDPEFFLGIISFEIVAVNTIALLLLGLLTYRRSGNLPVSLALQLTPFISVKAFSMNSVVMLEPFLLFTELLLLIVIANYVFNSDSRFTNRQIVVLALIMALGFTTKTVFLPVFFLPLFALDGMRRKLFYAVLIVAFSAIMLIPVYPTFNSFLSWYGLILTHTGPYGSGKAAIFDAGVYLHNLISVIRSNLVLTLAFTLNILAIIFLLIPSFGKQIPKQKKAIVYGLGATFLLNILMVAKHFSAHYLYVSVNLVVFSILLAISFIPEKFTRFFQSERRQLSVIYITGTLLLLFLIRNIAFSDKLVNPRLEAFHYVKSEVKTNQRIIVLENPGPFIETALYHGYAYSAGMMPNYAPVLKQLHSRTWFFNSGQERLHNWTQDGNLEYVLSQDHLTFIYCAHINDTLPVSLADKINSLKQSGLIQSVDLKYYDTIYNDRIYEVKTDTQRLRKLISQPDTLYKDNKKLKLSPGNPFGPLAKLKAEKGVYVITAMRNSADGKGSLVIADSTGRFYRSNAIALSKTGNKDRITLVADVPDYLTGSVLSFYTWYPGKDQCTFSDVRISLTRLKL